MPFFEAVMAAASHLKGNPYFSAGTGLIGVGAGMAVARAAARLAQRTVQRNFVLSMEIPSKDKSYGWMLHWLSKQPTVRTQHLSVETTFHQHENGDIVTRTNLYPNVGDHYFTHKGRFFKVERSREKSVLDVASGSVWETLTLTTAGRDRAIFFDLLEEAKKEALAREEGKTVIYTNGGGEWRRFGFPRKRRPLGSVVLDKGMSESLIDDVTQFLASSPWYIERGIPYRRGYLLHGPPGCGKSSFIYALAGELGLNICILNLASRGINDDVLNTLLINAPQRSIILLEDIDVAVEQKSEGTTGVTFSGLLNALDGVAATEGRVMFMTTNYLERLDPALIRPGRVDIIQKVDYASKHQIEHMFKKFFPSHDELAAQFAAALPDRTLSVAYLQNYLMGYKDSPQQAAENAPRILSDK